MKIRRRDWLLRERHELLLLLFRRTFWHRLLLAALPVLSQYLLLGGAVEKTAPLIGQFIRDCSVIVTITTHSERPMGLGRLFPRPNPTSFKGKAQALFVPPSAIP